MNKMSMSMVMGMAPRADEEKIRPLTVKKHGEMRQARRFPLSERVSYDFLWKSRNSSSAPKSQGIRKEAEAQNLSNGGICLLTIEALKTSEVLQLNLFVSRFGISIPTVAEVVWTSRRSGKGPYRAGLRYLL
jgi:hypothetical protein